METTEPQAESPHDDALTDALTKASVGQGESGHGADPHRE